MEYSADREKARIIREKSAIWEGLSVRRHAAPVNAACDAALLSKTMDSRALPTQSLTSRIHSIRGQKVLLDTDLADLYGVRAGALIQAVRRNTERFPQDFMFVLTQQEVRALRSQTVTLNNKAYGRGRHRKYLPYAFTEQGVAMLSSVLRSACAAQVNIEIMRAFVRLRGMIQLNHDLARRLDVLESKYDRQFKVVFDAIRELMTPPATPRRRIGFVSGD